MNQQRIIIITVLILTLNACTHLIYPPVELPPSAIKMQDGDQVILEDVLFEFDEAILRPQGWELVSAIARYMHSYPHVKVHVSGHTDNLGVPAYNLELSRRRAEAVRNILRARGIEAARITTSYYGAERPLVDNLTVENRQKNRRVEMMLTPK
jgi:outer membrane protein OmpA-like peptidoglycan-associated protein